MNRPRSAANRELPDNLHRKHDKRLGKTYYSYRDPRNGREHGLGSDHDSAVNDAKALNAAIYASIRSARIAALATDKPAGKTLLTLAMRHLALCEKRGLAANTIRSRKSQVGMWCKAFGNDRDISTISVTDFAGIISQYEQAGKDRSALAMRTAAVEMWVDALAEGWATDNIPDRTRRPVATVKRSRLTLDAFKAIYAVAGQVADWLPSAIALALVTSQRREDVAAYEFRKAAESTAWVADECLWVVQQKTGNQVCIPLSVTLQGFRLADLVKSCQGSIITRWMIHHRRPGAKMKPGEQVWRDTISRRFSDAVKMAGIQPEPGKTLPTFHELRSLSIRLYTEERGAAFAQAIAGHKDAATTAVYQDKRGSEWIRVAG